jgi:hypothetical protein
VRRTLVYSTEPERLLLDVYSDEIGGRRSEKMLGLSLSQRFNKGSISVPDGSLRLLSGIGGGSDLGVTPEVERPA